MSSEIERRKGGGKLSRSETVTVRLDPKLRYLAELSARRQRRTVSSYIEWAIEDSLRHFSLHLDGNCALADEAENLWDVDEADRFARLAFRHPDLLTHDEQVLWKLVKENGSVWRGKFAGSNQEWTWTTREEFFMYDRLRKHWATFCDVAEGNSPSSELPTWVKNAPGSANGFDEMDDDIPF